MKTAAHPTARIFALDFCADDAALLTQGKEAKAKKGNPVEAAKIMVTEGIDEAMNRCNRTGSYKNCYTYFQKETEAC